MARLREIGSPQEEQLVQEILAAAIPMEEAVPMELIQELAEKRVVMLGESSHGTREFYEFRARISQILIEQYGFHFVAVEGDWPPCRALHQWCQEEAQISARDALSAFTRWPTWMWANEEVASFAEWLKSHNARQVTKPKAGFFGLDVYSFFESADAVLQQTARLNPTLARTLKERYACLDPFSRDERAYARSLLRFPEGCQEKILQNLNDLLSQRVPDTEPWFDARQNARIVANAENYYRTMVHGSEDSWNVRDRHMLETLGYLLERYGDDSKAIIWAHNTHIGDYLATDMPRFGQINLGGLAREAFGAHHVALVGFGTYEGKVIASPSWDGPITKFELPKARPGSVERSMHLASATLGADRFYLKLGDSIPSEAALSEARGHRAIGVVYQPEHERLGNYVPTSLARRYDSFLFFDRSRPLRPLSQPFVIQEIPETWPQGL